MLITWNQQVFKIDPVTAAFWPNVIFILEESDEEPDSIRVDAHGTAAQQGEVESAGRFTLEQALQRLEEEPDDSITQLLFDRLVQFFFLEPVNAPQDS